MHEQHRELHAAVVERVTLGYSDAQIYEELRAAGYDDRTISEVIDAARYETDSNEHSETISKPLIKPGELLGDAFRLCVSEYRVFLSGLRDLILLFALAGGLFFAAFTATGIDVTALETLGEEMILQSLGLLAVAVVLLIAVGIVSRMITFAVQRTLQLRAEPGNTYCSNFKWSFTHIIAIFWLSILVSLTTQFAYTLIILPGIALAVYVLYANYILAVSKERGIAAIVSSIELVYGRWWGVFGRMLLVGAVSTLVTFTLAAVLSIGFFFLFETYPIASVVGVAVVFMGAMWLGFSFIVAAHVLLFESLQTTHRYRLSSERTRTLRTLLIIAAVLGLLLSLAGNYQDDAGTLDELRGMQGQVQDVSMSYEELSGLSVPAAKYYEASGRSYEGVCSELVSTLSYGEGLDCVDRQDRWALSMETESGKQLCVESERDGIAIGAVQAANATCSGEVQSLEILLQGEQRALKDRAQELRDMAW